MNTSFSNLKITPKTLFALTLLVLQIFFVSNSFAIKFTLNDSSELILNENVVYDYTIVNPNNLIKSVKTNTEEPYLCLGPSAPAVVPNLILGPSMSDLFEVYGLVGISSALYTYNIDPSLAVFSVTTDATSQCVVKGFTKVANPSPVNLFIFTDSFEDSSLVIPTFIDLSVELLNSNGVDILLNNEVMSDGNDYTYLYEITNIGDSPLTFDVVDYFSQTNNSTTWSCTESAGADPATDCGVNLINPGFNMGTAVDYNQAVFLKGVKIENNGESIIITVTRNPNIAQDNTPIDLLLTTIVTDGNDIYRLNNSDTRNLVGQRVVPSDLVITSQPTNTVSGQNISNIEVELQDMNGNVDTGNSDSVTIAIANNPASGILSGTLTVNAVAGIATFSGLSIDKVGAGYTLVVSSGSLNGATSSAFDISIGAASQLVVGNQPTATPAGVVMNPFTIEVQDQNGNLVTTATDSIAVVIDTNPTGGTLSGSVIVSAIGGIATFSNLSIDIAGTGYTLRTFTGSLTVATTNSIDISAGAATQVTVSTQPIDTVAGATISSVVVELQDANGNLNTTDTSNVTLAILSGPLGGNLSGTLTIAAVAGVATFNDLSLDASGLYTLRATSGVLTNADTSAFNITGGAATQIIITAQPSNTIANATMASVVFTLQDAFGNTDPNNNDSVTVFILSNPSSGTLSGMTTKAAVSGVVSFDDLSIDNIGSGYTLRGVDGSLGITSGVFDIN